MMIELVLWIFEYCQIFKQMEHKGMMTAMSWDEVEGKKNKKNIANIWSKFVTKSTDTHQQKPCPPPSIQTLVHF